MEEGTNTLLVVNGTTRRMLVRVQEWPEVCPPTVVVEGTLAPTEEPHDRHEWAVPQSSSHGSWLVVADAETPDVPLAAVLLYWLSQGAFTVTIKQDTALSLGTLLVVSDGPVKSG